ncbi:MAG: sulfatase-like hydrolase/transferase [Muribaculaceae bacterium]
MKHFKNIWDWCRNQEILFAIFIIMMIIPNILLCFTEFTSPFTKVISIILPLSIFWILMTLTKKPGKMLWILFLFVFFNAFQMVLLYLFGEAVIAVDMFLNLTTTNSGEVSELLGNLLPALLSVCILYISILTLAVLSLLNKKELSLAFRKSQRKLAFILLGISGMCVGINYAINSDFDIRTDIYPINVCYNVGLAVDRDMKTRNYFKTSEGFTFNAKSIHAKTEKEVYIFVVGETARAENFGIYGYKRNTTPNLSKMPGLAVFTDALSQSNTTHKSVPMLLSAASAENYDCIYKQKGIISAFKEAGFSTAFYSNQQPNRSFIDFFAAEADRTKFLREGLPDSVNLTDSILLNCVEKELKTYKGNKLFIVLHMYGSHFNYQGRYPKNDAVYKPDTVFSASYDQRHVLRNAYDNSIHYTDTFLSKLMKMVEATSVSSAIVYTSDHGEDIFDDDRQLFLHASPVPSAHQLYVPYLIWLSEEYKSLHNANYRNIMANQRKSISTNLVTFHTILSLGGISTPALMRCNSLADSLFKEKQRFYLNDHNRPKPMDKIGLRDEDIDIFNQYKIVFP